MKSQQVNFYLLPEEQRWFEEILFARRELVVVRRLASPKGIVTTDSTIVKAMGEEVLTVYLSRPTDLQKIITREVPARDEWLVDLTQSPVVEFSRCYFDGQLLRRGRLYVVTHYYDEDSLLVEKSKEFVAWAKSLISTVKKGMMKCDDGDFISILARERAERGEIELSAF